MRKWLVIVLLLFLTAAVVGWMGYSAIFSPNTVIEDDSDGLVLIPSGSGFSDLKSILITGNYLKSETTFDQVARLMKFSKPKPGQYLIKDGWSNKRLISMFRSGNQKPIDLTFNNVRTIDELLGLFGSRFESDSTSFSTYLLNENVLKKLDYSGQDVLSLFLPNTYQVFWNTSPEALVKRFQKEHDKFYNEERLEKLKTIGLSKKELYTLASIVQKETLVNDEKPTVAGVYLNRLKRGQLLQADPTVVYANGDFTLRRVLNKHLAKDSPYNTYKYQGLPPGPICMPDVSTIDAVLNYKKHKYLYFCASPDNSGRHVFARNLVEHNRNANKYRAYLNKARIYK